MRRFFPIAALALAAWACTLTGGPLGSTPPAPSETAPPVPTATLLPPSPTPVPPSPTPLPPVITAGNIASLSVSLSFGEGELVRSLTFSPDGALLAAAVGDEAGLVRLFDVSSGASVRTLEGHESIVWSVAFSPDGRFLASAARDYTAKIWDWRSGTLVKSLAFPNEVSSVAFSPDSRLLAVGGVDELPGTGLQDATIWTFAVDSWEPGLQFAEFWNIPDIAFTPDGAWIVGGGTSRNVRVWRTSDGAEQFILYHAGQVSSIDISPDGSTAATALCESSSAATHECTRGAIWLWDLATGTRIRQLSDFEGVVAGALFTADGSAVLGSTRGGTLRAYSTSDYHPLLVATVPPSASQAPVIALARSADGRWLATGGSGVIDLWRVAP